MAKFAVARTSKKPSGSSPAVVFIIRFASVLGEVPPTLSLQHGPWQMEPKPNPRVNPSSLILSHTHFGTYIHIYICFWLKGEVICSEKGMTVPSWYIYLSHSHMGLIKGSFTWMTIERSSTTIIKFPLNGTSFHGDVGPGI